MLLFLRKINETDIAPLIEKMVKMGKKDLIIFASDMDNEMVRTNVPRRNTPIKNKKIPDMAVASKRLETP